MEIALFILGALAGWLVTHIYAVRSSQEQTQLFDKLSADIRQVILQDTRESLTVAELNRLLTQKTVDAASPEPLPYIRCPKCGSESIKRKQYYDSSNDTVSYNVRCPDCRWWESTPWFDSPQTKNFKLWPVEDIK
jgi:DNA-directed RNA polymerase subunit RPC12/RpoP